MRQLRLGTIASKQMYFFHLEQEVRNVVIKVLLVNGL